MMKNIFKIIIIIIKNQIKTKLYVAPSGILKSLYRDGRWMSCDLEVRNFSDCVSAFYSVMERQVYKKITILGNSRPKCMAQTSAKNLITVKSLKSLRTAITITAIKTVIGQCPLSGCKKEVYL